MNVKAFFKKILNRENETQTHALERAFLSFSHTGEVIQAEAILKKEGFSVEVKAPPPEMRTGCDMVLVIDLIRGTAVQRTLENANIRSLQMTPVVNAMLEPVSLWQTTDYGNWLMVRATNMKITVEKQSGLIVNVSGGGCPDVPYLASKLMGQHINGSFEPKQCGQTLCAYALQLAFEEARRQWNG